MTDRTHTAADVPYNDRPIAHLWGRAVQAADIAAEAERVACWADYIARMNSDAPWAVWAAHTNRRRADDARVVAGEACMAYCAAR